MLLTRCVICGELFSLGSVAMIVFGAPGTLFSFWIVRHGYAVGSLPVRILRPHYLGGFHCLFRWVFCIYATPICIILFFPRVYMHLAFSRCQ